MNRINIKLTILGFSLLLWGCEGYLDEKPNQNLVVVNTLADVRSLLDNSSVFNEQPVLGVLAADNYYLADDGVADLSVYQIGSYFWMDDPFQGDYVGDWISPYEQVFYANVALDALADLGENEGEESAKLRGEALFHRAYAYYQLLQYFAPPYQMAGGNDQLLGIVLKDSPDVNEVAFRSNLEECYRKVLDDLNEAVTLLPDFQLPKTRPSKVSALGMLSRLHLTIFDYQAAAATAREALELYPDRLDFREADENARFPFERMGKEVMYYSALLTIAFNYSSQVYVDTVLAASYQENDLRLPVYFDSVGPNRLSYTGRLSGTTGMFGGLSVGELELNLAEGLARTGDEAGSIAVLEEFFSRRIAGDEIPAVDFEGKELIQFILDERRRELIGRGLRWTDLRRINQEADYKVTLEKSLNGQSYILEPNSLKYTYPIPDDEIILSGIRQNER
ncbi:SusD family protein [Algoriphagus locisalis]|uniref:SusD family protein n=1 Tax=Algoriphagus locisalis TaxID=305507 RepID=A0A1I7E549_9BACT|nr:RagB/SusD family nutrient uptake outer membrane protein [Algoriphagus locisalis]SFU19060.1 SusD family protein [Algoriphagus locisalis]